MIHGSSMEVRSRRGRDGMRIPGSGLAAHISPSEWASGSASSEGLDGAGRTGDSTGITMPFFTTTDRYFSRSRTFYNRNAYYRGGARGGVYNRPGASAQAF